MQLTAGVAAVLPSDPRLIKIAAVHFLPKQVFMNTSLFPFPGVVKLNRFVQSDDREL